MPVYNWFKLHENDDYRWLLKNKEDHDKIDKHDISLIAVWDGVFYSYIETFGINKEYRELLSKKKKALIFRLEAIEKNDKTLLLWAEKLDKEVEQMGQKETENMYVLLAHLGKVHGVQLDPFKTTVAQFFGYINLPNK